MSSITTVWIAPTFTSSRWYMEVYLFGFYTTLPPSKGCLLNLLDQFTEMTNFVPCFYTLGSLLTIIMFIVQPTCSRTCQRKMHPHCRMLECPETLKTCVAKDCLLQLQEVHTTFCHYLHDAQFTHTKLAYCHHLDSSRMNLHCKLGSNGSNKDSVKIIRPCNQLDCQYLGLYIIFHRTYEVASCMSQSPVPYVFSSSV